MSMEWVKVSRYNPNTGEYHLAKQEKVEIELDSDGLRDKASAKRVRAVKDKVKPVEERKRHIGIGKVKK